MRRRILVGMMFAALTAAGAVSASSVAGREPLQVVSSSSSTVATTTVTNSTTTTTTTTTTTGETTTTTTTRSKLTICHHSFGKKGLKHVTIRISQRAWPAHRRHGDSIGGCNTRVAKRFHSKSAHIKKFHHRKK